MKQGDRPPPGVKTRVQKLARRNPRPTNRVIADLLIEEFNVRISDRTIRRYCEEASLPVSSHKSTKEDNLQTRELSARAKLAEDFLKTHLENLSNVATELRSRIVVENLDNLWPKELGGRPYQEWMVNPEQADLPPFIVPTLDSESRSLQEGLLEEPEADTPGSYAALCGCIPYANPLSVPAPPAVCQTPPDLGVHLSAFR